MFGTFNFGGFFNRTNYVNNKDGDDPEQRDYVMATFSTTKEIAVVVASILFLDTLHAETIFVYVLLTQIITKSKERRVNSKIEKLKRLGLEFTRRYLLLKPVLSIFVRISRA
ncbi:hypothetical protein M501DRAFT_626421 [Patellaria atrata CBS 101060]|uniref:Uncharacterized protein n=1 Tax=Patellaria atrata CBS 101060 TaxID=1346257 RepID=A0A9P4VR87_9PEZI|nr:hypothetical protein M501DRAFT_626421 [Patellaria atrata CBS 101060]